MSAGRPPAFTYRKLRRGVFGHSDSILHCDQVPLTKLVREFGTPLYVYSASAIRERMRTFQDAFADIPHTVCYSVKANSNLGILRLLDDEGCGFDIVSGGELARVLKVNRRAAKNIVFSGVGKTAQEMGEALRAGILLFNVESESEMSALAQCAARMKKTAPVALRVNPDVGANTHPYISTGLRQHKFGIPIRDARGLYARAGGSEHLKMRGVSVHIGSQITELEPFRVAMERVAELVGQLRADGHPIEYVDCGGGLGIPYESAATDFAAQVAKYAEAVSAPLRGLDVQLLLEPGRSIVGPSGALVSCILYRKSNEGKNFLVLDAAMNDFLRPSLYNAYHEIVPVRMQDGPSEVTDIVGPICESGDAFAHDRELPALNEGDFLAILDVGAYGMTLASNYNSRPRAAEVLVQGKRARLIRKRETVRDLMQGEK